MSKITLNYKFNVRVKLFTSLRHIKNIRKKNNFSNFMNFMFDDKKNYKTLFSKCRVSVADICTSLQKISVVDNCQS